MTAQAWWRVVFADGSALYLPADNEAGASIRAKLAAWSVSGKWWPVTSVEQTNQGARA